MLGSYQIFLQDLYVSDPALPREEKRDFKINYTIAGTTVDVKFGPIVKDWAYCVCIVTDNTDYSKCDMKKQLDTVSFLCSFGTIEQLAS